MSHYNFNICIGWRKWYVGCENWYVGLKKMINWVVGNGVVELIDSSFPEPINDSSPIRPFEIDKYIKNVLKKNQEDTYIFFIFNKLYQKDIQKVLFLG